MDLKDAVYGRRAVRDYASDPVSDEVVTSLIEAAVQAPSAMNQQPWTFTVVRDQVLLNRVSRASKAYMLGNASAGSVPPNLSEKLNDPDFHIFYHAPVLIVVAATADGPWIVEDCALAAQNLMLSAFAQGLGSCWIGFAQKWLGTPDGKAALGIPAAHVPVAPIIVGRPKAPAPAIPRKAVDIRWLR